MGELTFKADPLTRLLRRMKRKLKSVTWERSEENEDDITITTISKMGKMTIELNERDHESIEEWIKLFDT